MALEITTDFDEPYFGAGQSLPGSFSPSVVGIAGIPYLMDTSENKYNRQGVDVVQQRNTNDQRDLLLLPQDVWRQQTQSWHLGSGQSNIDRDNAQTYRYQDSFGIDPWTQWQFSLLNECKPLAGTSGFTGKVWLTTYDVYLAAVNDQTIWWYNSVTASASMGSTAPNPTHTIVDIANTGTVVTTLHNDGKVYTTAGPGATPASLHTYAGANFIAYEKDYLLLGQTNKLYDITGSGAGTLVYTHPVAAFRWQSAAPGNSCIYLIGGVKDRYVVHRVGIKQDGTGLSPAIVAATLPDGEIAYTIDSYLGYVLIGTNYGVRVAVPNNDSGDLTLGPIIPTAAGVHCFEGQDRFVWFGMSSMDGSYSVANATESFFPAAPCPGLGRMDLSVATTTALTPGYANDLCVTTEAAAVTRSVVTYAGKRVFSVDDAGVFYEADTLMEAGWLIEGLMSFSVEDVKTGLYVQGKWQPLSGEIDFDLSYDSQEYRRIVDLKIQDSIRSGNTSMGGSQFSRLNARHVLKRDTVSQTEGPVFTRWEVRAIPAKGRASRWTLPIMNYEELEIDSIKYVRDPLTVTDTLLNLVESGQLFILQESGRSYQVHAKDYLWQPEKLTINGKAWQGVFTLVVEEVS